MAKHYLQKPPCFCTQNWYLDARFLSHTFCSKRITLIIRVECKDFCTQPCINLEYPFLPRYFTWYERPLTEKETEEESCHLVGFNLRQACFNLENRCVLLRECSQFNSSCQLCQVSTSLILLKRPLLFLILHLDNNI